MTFKEFLSTQTFKPKGAAFKRNALPAAQPKIFNPKKPVLPRTGTSYNKSSLVSAVKRRKWDTKVDNRFNIRKGSSLDSMSSN